MASGNLIGKLAILAGVFGAGYFAGSTDKIHPANLNNDNYSDVVVVKKDGTISLLVGGPEGYTPMENITPDQEFELVRERAKERFGKSIYEKLFDKVREISKD